MASSTLTIRLDNELKEEAAQVVERYGLDLSTAIRAFFTQIVNTKAIPLSFDYERQGAGFTVSNGEETAVQDAISALGGLDGADALVADGADAPMTVDAVDSEAPAAAYDEPDTPEPYNVSTYHVPVFEPAYMAPAPQVAAEYARPTSSPEETRMAADDTRFVPAEPVSREGALYSRPRTRGAHAR